MKRNRTCHYDEIYQLLVSLPSSLAFWSKTDIPHQNALVPFYKGSAVDEKHRTSRPELPLSALRHIFFPKVHKW